VTRVLRRVHLVVVTGIAVSLAVVLPVAFSNIPPGQPLWGSAVDRPGEREGPRVVAAAAWAVGRDTLFMEILADSNTFVRVARFRASAGARWPDAVISWWPGPIDDAPEDGEVVLGIVAAGTLLSTTLPAPGGGIRLVSRAWSQELGRWAPPATGDNRSP
jgi:hypothetical protein